MELNSYETLRALQWFGHRNWKFLAGGDYEFLKCSSLREELSLCWPDPAVELSKRFQDEIIEKGHDDEEIDAIRWTKKVSCGILFE